MNPTVDTTGLLLDSNVSGHPVQGFVADPAKQQVPFALAASFKVFKRGAGGDYNLKLPTGWMAICITPSASNLIGYFNGDTTKTWTIFGGQANILLIHPNVTQITIFGTDARVEVAGM